MFYLIEGRRYEALHPRTFDLNVLRDIKKSTGLKMSDLEALMAELARKSTLDDILDDEAALLGFSVLIWAARRSAGELIDMEAACRFDLTTFATELTDEEREVASKARPRDHEPPDPRKARSPRKSPADKRTGRKATAAKRVSTTTSKSRSA